MRSKLIITGAIGILAAAALTVNAQYAAGHNATRAIAATVLAAHSVSADREEVATRVEASESPEATPSATAKTEADEASKDADKTPSPTPALSSACQAAITGLKTMHQADVAEDAAERTSAAGQSETAVATGDRVEDAAEAQHWMSALSAARTACASEPLVRCVPTLSSLQTILQTLRAQEAAEPQGAEATDMIADFSALRTAFSAVATTCEPRE